MVVVFDFLCLSVSRIIEKLSTNFTDIFGGVEYLSSNESFDFAADVDRDPDLGILTEFFAPRFKGNNEYRVIGGGVRCPTASSFKYSFPFWSFCFRDDQSEDLSGRVIHSAYVTKHCMLLSLCHVLM